MNHTILWFWNFSSRILIKLYRNVGISSQTVTTKLILFNYYTQPIYKHNVYVLYVYGMLL